ncbi:MAG: helix-turn-helix transcriptional regulator [Bacteroidales bacterium]|nr:helix-turn-helix transcriptional regulator [Bacteroidales bacterium]
MDLGPIIAERRKALRITQIDLAEMAQVGLATVKDIERGKGNPSVKTLEKICTVLGFKITLQIPKPLI